MGKNKAFSMILHQSFIKAPIMHTTFSVLILGPFLELNTSSTTRIIVLALKQYLYSYDRYYYNLVCV